MNYITPKEVEDKFEEEFGVEYPKDNPLSGTNKIKNFIKQQRIQDLESVEKIIVNEASAYTGDNVEYIRGLAKAQQLLQALKK